MISSMRVRSTAPSASVSVSEVVESKLSVRDRSALRFQVA